MSILTRTRRLNTTVPSRDADPAPTASAVHHEVEAPEQAATPREAPESRRGRPVEAPDAGEGRAHYFEHEFTHGRSQS